MHDAKPIIQVRHLSKRFGRAQAIDDLCFSVHRGEILGLLGPNGAGKTTTIHILLGLITPSAGEVEILGMPMPGRRLAILERLNFSSAYISLPANLTVRENLAVFARLYGIAQPVRKIEELLEAFEMIEAIDTITGRLSSGQQTRLNLCKSFLNDPEVLFLDEPTASLDPDVAAKVRDQLQRMRKERQVAMIYTSHNMEEVELMCDRVIFIAHGRVVMQGTPGEIIRAADKSSLEELFIAIARGGAPHGGDQGRQPACGDASAR